jgi:hypothetical protein
MIRFPIEALFFRVVEKNTMKIATTSDLPLATAFLEALTRLLNPQGVCIMQTLHPVAFSKDGEYADGWKPGTWAGLPGNLGKPCTVVLSNACRLAQPVFKNRSNLARSPGTLNRRSISAVHYFRD